MTTETAAVLDPQDPPGTIRIGGKLYMPDAKGALVPIDLVKAKDRLEDEMVRKMIGFAVDLNAQIARFRGHCFDDIGSFQALLAQEYGAEKGGAKGNVTFNSYDGTMRVKVQVADLLEFGAELQAAKKLVDACLTEWSAGTADELQAVVNRAFQVDREGKINRSELFMLLRVSIEDARWQRGMDAIRDSIRVIGSKTYIRFLTRPDSSASWTSVTIDLAAAS